MSDVNSFLSRIQPTLIAWYGNFNKQELKKYLMLGLSFALILSAYWTLRALKDSIFGGIVIGYGTEIAGMGREMFLACAKVVSLTMLIPFVIGYSKLVDRYKKDHLLYALGLFYICGLLLWTLFFLHPQWGLTNTIANPWRLSGWLWYVFVESFGTLFITLFWAFTIDISDQKSAQRGFAIIVMLGQLGGIIIPRILTNIPHYFGVPTVTVIALCSLLVLGTLAVIRIFTSTVSEEYIQGYQGKKQETNKAVTTKEPGFLEGLKLLVSHGYLLGIFAVISFFEIIMTVIDYNFKILALKNFTSEPQALAFLGNYASAINITAFFCLFFGINNIQRRLGIHSALIFIPITVATAIVIFFLYPQLDVLFYILVGAKAINYSLNGPTLKQLYIPTSHDVRYKTQAWIEAFGGRGAKASASFFNISKSFIGAYPYMLMVATFSLSLAALWFFVALYLAKKYNKAINEKSIVC